MIQATITGLSGQEYELRGEVVDTSDAINLPMGFYIFTNADLRLIRIKQVFSNTPYFRAPENAVYYFQVKNIAEQNFEAVMEDLSHSRKVEKTDS